jgi:hypothetical protein
LPWGQKIIINILHLLMVPDIIESADIRSGTTVCKKANDEYEIKLGTLMH